METIKLVGGSDNAHYYPGDAAFWSNEKQHILEV